MSAPPRDCDVAIIGGGLAGCALAHALAQTPLDVVLVEAQSPATMRQPSFDDRATALANGSQRILATLGLWDAVRADTAPIASIHISERGRFGAARIRAAQEGVPALGYLVENRVLGSALWRALDEHNRIETFAPAELESLDAQDDFVSLVIAGTDRKRTLRAKLVVAADGAQSQVRAQLGIAAIEADYAPRAGIVHCQTDVPHRGRAFERFTTDGPVAVLPLTDERVAVVWTLPQATADRVMQLDDRAFALALQSVFGYRLGRLRRVGRRASYALTRTRSTALVATRTVLIGSAAVNLHPVAGQGFNLALRDIAALAEVLGDALLDSVNGCDPGAQGSLERYRDWRVRDQERVAAFTHGLIRFFGYSSIPLGVSRGLGLMLFDLLPGAKAGLARQTMGLAGHLPRLARGLPLLPKRSSL
jgi:2-octaprenyl-6-methoxyphenol hydroxylase